MELTFSGAAIQILESTGLSAISGGQVLMLGVACVLLYLAIWKKFEPLLLLPMAESYLGEVARISLYRLSLAMFMTLTTSFIGTFSSTCKEMVGSGSS